MVPLPLRDENPTRRAPVVTYTLIAFNVLVWFWELSLGLDRAVYAYGAVPHWVLAGLGTDAVRIGGGEFPDVPARVTVLTSMFLHGGWLHLIGNLWFLKIFGDNVEDAMTRPRFVVFYLLCGVAAAAAQIFTSPGSNVPMVGASGAIAGVLGGYLLLYPKARIKCLWILLIFITNIELPAALLLGLWFLSQFFIPTGSGIAWMAHVGGFIAGLVLVHLFVVGRPPPRRRDVQVIEW